MSGEQRREREHERRAPGARRNGVAPAAGPTGQRRAVNVVGQAVPPRGQPNLASPRGRTGAPPFTAGRMNISYPGGGAKTRGARPSCFRKNGAKISFSTL